MYYLRLNCLYVLFVDAFIQNTVLPFLYTSFGASRSLVASLLISKEILLLVFFIYCIFLWRREVRQPWPKPAYILFLFTAYCVLRVGIGLLLADDPAQSFKKLRQVCLPLQFLIIAITVARTHPEFAKKFLRQMTYLLAFLALLGILMWLLPARDFWLNHANMADYGLDIRGEDPDEVLVSEGVRNTAKGRDAFLFLAPFRAFGTFGDPFAMGFALTPPFLLLAFIYRKRWFTGPLLVILAVAIFATFDRSVWILIFVAGLFVLFRRRKYKWLVGLGLLPILALLTVAPMAEFAKSEYVELSWSHPEGSHAEGIVWLYQRAFTDPSNLLGKGMRDDVVLLTESGYGFLLEHFGSAAYIAWMWFLFAMYRYLKLTDSSQGQLALLSRAMILGTLVIMHFSQYPFSFIGWLPIWYVFGLSMAGASTEASPAASPRKSWADHGQGLLPESGTVGA